MLPHEVAYKAGRSPHEIELKTRFQQTLAAWLALSLAFAGAVGLSPVLHVWVEHGGNGQAHIHAGGGAAVAHAHADGAAHPHRRAERARFGQVHYKRTVAHEFAPFTLPAFSLNDLRAFAQKIIAPTERTTDDSDSKEGSDSHQHHSLPQLLAGGLVEQCLDAPAVHRADGCDFHPIARPELPIITRDFDSQTAGRGPPVSQS